MGSSLGTALIGALLFVGIISGLASDIATLGLVPNATQEEIQQRLLIFIEKM